MFGRGDMDQIRSLFESSFLTDNLTVSSIAYSQDSETGDDQYEITASISYACIVEPISSDQKQRVGIDRNVRAFSVTVPHDAVVDFGDKIAWNDLTLTLHSIMGPDTNQVMLELVATEVQIVQS